MGNVKDTPMFKVINTTNVIAKIFIVMGAILLFFYGILGLNLVEMLFGADSFLSNFYYILSGISVIWIQIFWNCPKIGNIKKKHTSKHMKIIGNTSRIIIGLMGLSILTKGIWQFSIIEFIFSWSQFLMNSYYILTGITGLWLLWYWVEISIGKN